MTADALRVSCELANGHEPALAVQVRQIAGEFCLLRLSAHFTVYTQNRWQNNGSNAGIDDL